MAEQGRKGQGEGETGTVEKLAWAMAESGLFQAIVQPALPACPGTRTLHELCRLGLSLWPHAVLNDMHDDIGTGLKPQEQH